MKAGNAGSRTPWITTAGLLLTGIIGLFDHLSGYEISFSIFYVAPVVMTTWYRGRTRGLSLAFICAGTWMGVDLTSGHVYSAPWIVFWNAFVRLGFFVIINQLVWLIQLKIRMLEDLSRVDPLTGVSNSRGLYELMGREIEKARRYGEAFTVVYFDIDNFKTVNDTMGHQAGDRLLRELGGLVSREIRKTDIFGRVGGDEFVLYLPNSDYDHAEQAIRKLYGSMIEYMEGHGWPVTCSIGAVTFSGPAAEKAAMDTVIRAADELMYQVKHAAKNGILHRAAA